MAIKGKLLARYERLDDLLKADDRVFSDPRDAHTVVNLCWSSETFVNMFTTMEPSNLIHDLKAMSEVYYKARPLTFSSNVNLHFRDDFRNEFTFMYSRESNNNGILYLWDISGGIALGQWLMPKENPMERLALAKQAVATAEAFHTGIVKCSGCRTTLNLKEMVLAGKQPHRYYAGTYCDSCWENGVKQEAQNDNGD